MLYKDINIDCTKKLILKGVADISFKLFVTEPLVEKTHFIKKKIVDCIEPCDYCITMRTLSQANNNLYKDFIPLKRHFLPVEVYSNKFEIVPDIYNFVFGKMIFDAYMQLLHECNYYDFDDESYSNLIFHYKINLSDKWPDYSNCTFIFKNKKLTVKKLIDDMLK